MSETLVWWLAAQLVALAALPLCLNLFGRLPDRGYSFAKAFGLLVLGYLFWVLNVMRVLPNSTGGIWAVLVLLLAASGLLFWRRREELGGFLRGHLWLIGTVEAVFFLSFVTAAYLRSYVPEIAGTEKPMDFMFLNAVTRGERFPPPDAWLAGHDVSYYYFGYLLVSIMTRLSGVATSVGFNLGLAMIAALAVTGAFGLVYNMTAPRERAAAAGAPGTPRAAFASTPLWRPVAFGLAAGLLLAVMGNLVGLLELFAAHGFGSSGFWSWVNIRDSGTGALALDSYDSSRWYPDQHWFWWRSTRVLDGGAGIHEMPFFSFLLGDLHPHVMSIPFVLLAAGGALALLRSEEPLDVVVWLERPIWLLAFGVMLGALAFLNTWDMPTMAFVIALAALVRNRLLGGRWSWGLALDTAGFVAPLYLVAFLAYTPFFFGGFDSQAAGFTAEGRAGSGLFHTFLLWGPFATIVLPYAVWRIARHGGISWRAAAWSCSPAVLVIALWAVWDGLAQVFEWLPLAVRPNEATQGFADRVSERGWNWLTVGVVGTSVAALCLALAREAESTKRDDEASTGHVFALMLAATAALLVLGVEFFYIQDGFGSRLNTIFKLYYQSWLLLSVAGGFVLYELARGWPPPRVVLPGAARVSLSLGSWSLGELGVAGATVLGAVIGVILSPGLLTSVFGAIVGGGA
jgi:YYY domain-containing protein